MSLTLGHPRRAFDTGWGRQDDQLKRSISQRCLIHLFLHYQHFLGESMCQNPVLWIFFSRDDVAISTLQYVMGLGFLRWLLG